MWNASKMEGEAVDGATMEDVDGEGVDEEGVDGEGVDGEGMGAEGMAGEVWIITLAGEMEQYIIFLTHLLFCLLLKTLTP